MKAVFQQKTDTTLKIKQKYITPNTATQPLN